jgi:hypothetical protein
MIAAKTNAVISPRAVAGGFAQVSSLMFWADGGFIEVLDSSASVLAFDEFDASGFEQPFDVVTYLADVLSMRIHAVYAVIPALITKHN